MNTAFLVSGFYNGMPLIPLNIVCKDFFTHLTPEKLLRKINEGKIPLPVTKMEDSQKSPKMIHVVDLAKYIDTQRQAALAEFSNLYE